MARRRIAIVTEDPALATELRGRIERLGHEVAGVAVSRREAARMAAEVCPDATLLDVRIENESGRPALEADGPGTRLPVVRLAAGPEEDAPDGARGNRDVPVVRSPFSEAELDEAIERAVNGGSPDGGGDPVRRLEEEIERRRRAEAALEASERHLREFYDSVPVGLYCVKPDGEIVNANRALARIVGLPDAESLISRNVREFYPKPEDRREPVRMLDGGAGLREYEIQVRRVDGRPVRVKINARAEFDEAGRPLRYNGIIEDITKRHETESLLRQSETWLQLILRHSFDAVSISTIDPGTGRRKLLVFNDRLVEMSGQSRETLAKCDDIRSLIVARSNAPGPCELDGRTLPDLHPWGEGSWRREDGRENYFEWSSAPARAGRWPFVVTIDRDVTERVRLRRLMKILLELAINLGQSIHLDEALEHVLDAVFQIPGIDGAGVYEIVRPRGELRLACHRGFSDEFIEKVRSYPLDSPQARVVLEGKPIYDTPEKVSRKLGTVRPEEDLTVLGGVPIRSKEGVIGCLNVASRRMDRFPDHTRYAIETIAAQTGQLIERIRTSQLLRKSEANYRAIVEDQTELVCRCRLDGTLTFVNGAYARFYEKTPEELVGTTFLDLLPPEDRDRARAYLKAFSPRNHTQVVEHAFTDTKGRPRVLYWVGRALYDDAGNLLSLQTVGREMTEQRLAEENARRLARELMRAQEEERRRVARDLHDGVAQDLSSLQIALETLFDGGEPTPSARSNARLEKAKALLSRTVGNLRDLAYGLRPPALDQLGLPGAIEQLCRDFPLEDGLEIEFVSAGLEERRLDFDTEINFYRIAQEALANACRHAGARHVTIRLAASHPSVVLTVEDDGRGFDAQARRAEAGAEKRMGLSGIEERALALDGRFQLRSAPGRGTRLRVEAPLREA